MPKTRKAIMCIMYQWLRVFSYVTETSNAIHLIIFRDVSCGYCNKTTNFTLLKNHGHQPTIYWISTILATVVSVNL